MSTHGGPSSRRFGLLLDEYIQSNVRFLENEAITVRLLGFQMCSKPPNEYRSGGAANSGCCFVPATKAAIFAFTNIETHSRASKDSEQPSFHAILCLPAHIVCATQRLAFFKSSSWIARRTLTALSSSHRQIKTSGNREIYYPSSARAVKFDCKGIVFFMKCELSGIQAIAKMEGTAGIGAVPTAFLWLRSAKSSGQRGPAERRIGRAPAMILGHGCGIGWPCKGLAPPGRSSKRSRLRRLQRIKNA